MKPKTPLIWNRIDPFSQTIVGEQNLYGGPERKLETEPPARSRYRISAKLGSEKSGGTQEYSSHSTTCNVFGDYPLPPLEVYGGFEPQ